MKGVGVFVSPRLDTVKNKKYIWTKLDQLILSRATSLYIPDDGDPSVIVRKWAKRVDMTVVRVRPKGVWEDRENVRNGSIMWDTTHELFFWDYLRGNVCDAIEMADRMKRPMRIYINEGQDWSKLLI